MAAFISSAPFAASCRNANSLLSVLEDLHFYNLNTIVRIVYASGTPSRVMYPSGILYVFEAWPRARVARTFQFSGKIPNLVYFHFSTGKTGLSCDLRDRTSHLAEETTKYD
jgi:hypothetical protein